ncbi:hypothetical protein BU17DRAFT_76955 [Hysterangium stoloniferum]|nr:hypothetical protein BU17DRAFT_76955 [Hysterangium stoloniferum]
MAVSTPPVHLIIRLPYNRAEAPINEPPLAVQWDADKEKMLWEVIARSRAADSGGTDWQALSAHLQVPLPYLLYRAQIRYEEDLRTLQDIKSTLGASNSLAPRTVDGRAEERVPSAHTLPSRGGSGMVSSSRRRTPVTTHQRFPSQPILANRLLRDQGSASVLSFSHRRGLTPNDMPIRPTTPPSDSSESDEDADRVEEEARRLEEQEAVGRRLKELEKMMSSDALGFARPLRIPPNAGPSTVNQRSPLREAVQHAESASESSIPSIPSPPQESPISSAHATTTLPSNSETSSLHSPRLRPPRRGVSVRVRPNQKGSSHGSAASSFSDLSDAPSVSASALESALMSNIRGGGSRL